MDTHKRVLIDKVVDEWAGIITGILNHQNTPQNKMMIKQRLNEKSIKYTPIIDQMLGERLDNNPNDEVFYKYELYELFIEEIKDNFNTRFCQRPQDGLAGAMDFISLSEDNNIIRQEVFDERSVVMLSLKYDDVDEINEHDKIAITKNQNKKDIRKRALVIRDGVVNFLTNCIYDNTQNNQSQNQYYDYAGSSSHRTQKKSNDYDRNPTSQKSSFWSFGRMRRTTYALFSVLLKTNT
ncbi:hypothetical protein [Moraxella caprae]|nr:hypothetical protein [Moraxella caprae]